MAGRRNLLRQRRAILLDPGHQCLPTGIEVALALVSRRLARPERNVAVRNRGARHLQLGLRRG